VAITQAALAKRIRDLKLAIAEAVVQARACTLLDNLEGSHQALQRARQFQREYHHFYAEWQRLNVGAGHQGLSQDEIAQPTLPLSNGMKAES
jgi:hypothetical protein